MTNLPDKDYGPKRQVRANEVVHLVHPSYINFSLLGNTATQDDVRIAIASARGVPCPPETERDSSSNEIRKGPCLKSTFPFKLHEILSDPTISDVITWLPHGRSWRVLNTKAFSDRVLSSYFKQTKYTSFIRQINGWGFHRVKIGPDRNTYYHELFLRGLPHLAQFMRRGRSSVTSINNCSQKNDGSDPDFYMISKVYPLPPFNDQPSVDEERSTPQPGSDGHVRLKAPRSSHEESNREPDHLLVDDRGPQQHDHDADHFEDDGRQPSSNPHRVKDDRLQAPRSSHAGSYQRHDNQQREFGLQQHDAFVRHFDEHARQPQDQPSATLWRQNDAQYSIPQRVEDGHTYNRLHAPRSSHPGSYQRHDHLQDDWSPQQHDHSVTSVHHTEEPHSLQPLEQQSSLLWSQNHSQYEGREVKMGSDGMLPWSPPRVHPLTNQPSRRQQQDNCGPLPIADGIGSLDRTSFVFDQQSAEETSAMLQRLLD